MLIKKIISALINSGKDPYIRTPDKDWPPAHINHQRHEKKERNGLNGFISQTLTFCLLVYNFFFFFVLSSLGNCRIRLLFSGFYRMNCALIECTMANVNVSKLQTRQILKLAQCIWKI